MLFLKKNIATMVVVVARYDDKGGQISCALLRFQIFLARRNIDTLSAGKSTIPRSRQLLRQLRILLARTTVSQLLATVYRHIAHSTHLRHQKTRRPTMIIQIHKIETFIVTITSHSTIHLKRHDAHLVCSQGTQGVHQLPRLSTRRFPAIAQRFRRLHSETMGSAYIQDSALRSNTRTGNLSRLCSGRSTNWRAAECICKEYFHVSSANSMLCA
jgi:hypothetical protein